MKENKQKWRVTIYVSADTLDALEARRRELSKQGFLPSLSQVAGGAIRKGIEAQHEAR